MGRSHDFSLVGKEGKKRCVHVCVWLCVYRGSNCTPRYTTRYDAMANRNFGYVGYTWWSFLHFLPYSFGLSEEVFLRVPCFLESSHRDTHKRWMKEGWTRADDYAGLLVSNCLTGWPYKKLHIHQSHEGKEKSIVHRPFYAVSYVSRN